MRDIHAKCGELLFCLILRGTPLRLLYQVSSIFVIFFCSRSQHVLDFIRLHIQHICMSRITIRK